MEESVLKDSYGECQDDHLSEGWRLPPRRGITLGKAPAEGNSQACSQQQSQQRGDKPSYPQWGSGGHSTVSTTILRDLRRLSGVCRNSQTAGAQKGGK